MPLSPARSPRPGLALRALRFGRRRAAAAAGAATAVLARARAERRAAQLAKLRALAFADPSAALVRLVRARRLRDSRFLAEAEALLAVQVHGWRAAAPRFAALPPPDGGPSAAGLLRRDPGPGLDLALPVPDRPAALPRAVAERLLVATARFGDGPPPAPPFQAPRGLRFLLLTDRALAVPGWETVPLPAPDPDPARAMLHARIRGAEILARLAPEAEASLYLDPELRLVGNLDTLLARWLAPRALALWRHPRARCWREAIADGLLNGAGPGALVDLAEACEAAGLPAGPACDTRALWRRHDDPGVAALMAAWWERATPATADAAFAALLADPAAPAQPRILPASLGPLEDGLYLAAVPWPVPAPRPARPRSPAGRLPLTFLYAEEFASTASTFLRRQLAELVAEHVPDRYDIAWTSDFEGTRDRVVVLVKGALQTRRPEALAALRARNLATIGCWDDLKSDPERVAALDANMALSQHQMLDFARRYPATPSFHVRCPVNRLIRPVTPPDDRLRTGYFGELANTVRPDSLSSMIELVGISTARNESDWMRRLPEFNCHWIVRQRRPIDGAKPFLKGFLAARCGAVVVVAREDEDALYYLGDDYPFFVTSLDPADLEADMVGIAAGFGGPDWRLAQAIMQEVRARSTDAVVAAEFRAMIEALTA